MHVILYNVVYTSLPTISFFSTPANMHLLSDGIRYDKLVLSLAIAIPVLLFAQHD